MRFKNCSIFCTVFDCFLMSFYFCYFILFKMLMLFSQGKKKSINQKLCWANVNENWLKGVKSKWKLFSWEVLSFVLLSSKLLRFYESDWNQEMIPKEELGEKSDNGIFQLHSNIFSVLKINLCRCGSNLAFLLKEECLSFSEFTSNWLCWGLIYFLQNVANSLLSS